MQQCSNTVIIGTGTAAHPGNVDSPSGAMSGSIYSKPLDVFQQDLIGFDVYETAGASGDPTGTYSIRGSNSIDPNNAADRTDDNKWIAYTPAVAAANPAGSVVAHKSAICIDFPFRFIQFKYTRASGGATDTVTVIAMAKG